MIIITSAAYVGNEFEAEVGRIPACMLPIGNRKLIELQTQALRQVFPHKKLVLTLPESYHLSIDEQVLIAQLDLIVQVVPDAFSLGNEILYVLNIESDKHAQDIHVLFGNKLIIDLPTQRDVLTVARSDKKYDWQVETLPDGKSQVWGGFFGFGSRQTLIKALALSKGKFVKAIHRYRKEIPLTLVTVQSWYDCGYINTFFNARANITTQRSFNSLLIACDVLTKTSENNPKIVAEAQWFLNLPPSLKKFAPQLIDYGALPDSDTAFYCLEYLPLLPLNELFVHGRNSVGFWKEIFGLLADYLDLSTRARPFDEVDKAFIKTTSDKLYRDKTRARLTAFSQQSAFDLSRSVCYQGKAIGSVQSLSEACIDKALALPQIAAVLHGDLCFSNILFDARGHRIKVIDPRGMDEAGVITPLGNQTYDLAKLTHSVIGLYDFIIAGRYHLETNHEDFCQADDFSIGFDLDAVLTAIQQTFMQGQFHPALAINEIMPAVVILFLSMLPLHADRPDRQRAMLVNALRLYAEYVADEADLG